MEKDHGFTDRIIKDIHNVMQKNDLLAFEIVSVDGNHQNKSPVLHIENWLGLESWCVKHVYMNCYSEIIDKYFPKPKRKALKVTSFNSENLTRLLNVTLLLNPEVSSFWNKRREMVLKSFLDKSFELTFTKLVLSRKPKSNDAFSYRRWILNLIFTENVMDNRAIENLVSEELIICELASDKSPNNYHSWNHRTWFVKKLKDLEKQFDLNFFYIKEYEFSDRWTAKHISDYSCFHYRQFCIKNIFDINNSNWIMLRNILTVNFHKSFIKSLIMYFPKGTIKVSETNLLSFPNENLVKFLFSYMKNCKCVVNYALVCRKLEFLFHELLLNNDLILFYKHHETLWYHRRFIVHEVLQILYDHFGLVHQNGSLIKNSCRNCTLTDPIEKQSKMGRYDSNKIYSCVLFNVLLNIEKTFITERQNGDTFADKHKKYLNYVEGLKVCN